MKAILILLTVFSISCSKTRTIVNSGCQTSTTPSGTEEAYGCSVAAPTTPVTISGKATYTKRLLTSSGLAGPSSNQNIPFAEVVIKNSSGQVLGCGETDASGDFSITIQSTSASIYAEVRSRGFNANLKASVLNNHTNTDYYTLRSSSVTGNSTQSVGTFTAPYNGDVSGGAFHILNLIYQANVFLNANTSLSVADKVTVFWEAGVNPAERYLCFDATNTVSFYLSGTDQLYIVGGVDGDVNSSDTDHFDDIIVLHEYGHFLEDKYSISNSPGGSHNGNSIIDPRLAWSEAWATYFATIVSGTQHYQDTSGNSDGTQTNLIYYDIENNSPARDPSGAYVVAEGEGNFREFAIARALLDATDLDVSDDDNDGYEAVFSEFWNIFTGGANFANAGLSFRFAGKFFAQHDASGGRTDVKGLLDDEQIYNAASADFDQHYASPLTSCPDITPKNGNSRLEDGSFENSNQFASNDFYEYAHPGGSLTISLTHDDNQDLDLYLYDNDYTYGASTSVLAFSNSETSTTESFSLTLNAGTYMINVRVFPSFAGSVLDTTTASYSMTVTNSGATVCP